MFRSVVIFFFVILIFILIVDPGDLIFQLKTPLFVLIFITWFIDKIKSGFPIKYSKDILIVIAVFLLVPIYGLCSGFIQNSIDDRTFAIAFLKSFSVIVLLFIVVDYELVLDKYLNPLCIIIPLIIIPVYFLSITNTALFSKIYQYLNFEKDVAKFGIRNFYGVTVLMFFYRTSPLLVFPLSYYLTIYLNKRKFSSLILVLFFSFTLMLSGTRANLLAALLVFAYNYLSHQFKKVNKLPLILTLMAFIVGLYFLISSLNFDQKETSAEVKSGHVNSYIELFKTKPGILVWGQGLGSKFYSSGYDDQVSQTELTYFELLRVFGIPVTLLLLLFMIYPLVYLYGKKKISVPKYPIIAYIAYLFIVGTNPLLVSSTGMLVIITMYSFANIYENADLVSDLK